MTLKLQQEALDTFFMSQWEERTSVGYIGDGRFERANNTVRLTVQNGTRLQGSLGRENNRIDNWGLLTVQLFTNPLTGEADRLRYSEIILGIFHGVTIDNEGVPITDTADAFLRFSPVNTNGVGHQHPYISAESNIEPFKQTNIAVPFVRYEYR